MKKSKVKDTFLAELRKIPIIQVACEKTGVSRTSIYRWRESDPEFVKEMDMALADGEALLNDLTESQLLTLIKEKNFSAISFWLRHRNTKFKERVELEGAVNIIDELSPEHKKMVCRALELSKINLPHDEQETKR